MLYPDYIRHMTDGSEQIASVLHEEIIKRIVARLMARLAKGENYLTSTDKWNLKVLADAGYLMEDIQREIADRTPLLLEEVARAFEDAAVQALRWDDAVYQAAGLEPTPLRQSPYLLRLAQRNYEKTCGELQNFTGTLAESAQQSFIRACDRAYQLVTGGALGYTQAVRQAVETAAADGVVVTYPSGHRDTIEAATLRAVRTGVGQACGEMSMARMRQMGWKIVLVSAHLGARTGDGGEDWTNHFWWQGKFYRLDDEDGSGTEDAAPPQQNEAKHPKIAAEQSGTAPAGEPAAEPAPKRIEPEDVTEEYLRTATPGQGKITYDEGYRKGKYAREVNTAEWLHDRFGGDIRLLRESSEFGIKTPDYEWRGKLWDLKNTTTAKAADAAVRHALKQIKDNPGGVILDYGDADIVLEELEEVLLSRIRRSGLPLVDIIILMKNELKKIIRYKK